LSWFEGKKLLGWFPTIPYLDAGKIGQDVRGMLGNKCTRQHNLKTVKVREIM
jgi:hypothetical protein